MLIELTRIDGSKIHLNPFQIEMVEKKVNTVVRMMNEVMYIVIETPQEINEKMNDAFRSLIEEVRGR